MVLCMMHIMRKTQTSIRTAAKEASHERIVQAAARAIRRSGYDGTGVADIMKEAGLTHGAFYAHFESREAMLAEAADRAGAESNAFAASVIAAVPPEQALQALMQPISPRSTWRASRPAALFQPWVQKCPASRRKCAGRRHAASRR
jgi:AcrR family transcriptional regulator